MWIPKGRFMFQGVANPVRDTYYGFCHSKTLTCLIRTHTFVTTKEGSTSIHKTKFIIKPYNTQDHESTRDLSEPKEHSVISDRF